MSLTLDPDGSTISDGILQIEPKKGAGTYLHVDAFAAKYKISGKLKDGVLSLTFTQIVRQPPTIGMTLLRIVTEFSDGLMQDDGSCTAPHFPGPPGGEQRVEGIYSTRQALPDHLLKPMSVTGINLSVHARQPAGHILIN